MSYFSTVLKEDMFVKKKRKDESSSEEDISSETSHEDDEEEDDDDDEYTDTESGEEEIDVGGDNYCKDSQNSQTMNSQRRRFTRGNKPAPRKRNRNNSEKGRRSELGMCYDALREAIGYPNASRNRTIELAMEGIKDLAERIALVNRERRINEEILEANKMEEEEERRQKRSR